MDAPPKRITALAIALAWIVAAPVCAQERVAIGSGPWAMPSLHRVLVARETEPGVDVAAMGGYAYTEDVLGVGDAHHRALGDVALAGRPLSWLTIAGRVDGRWDHHLLGGTVDQSAVGEARLALRGDFDLAPNFALGLAGIVFVPGSDAPSLTFDATTVDLRGLASWTPEGTSLTMALDLGFRLDRTAYAVPQRPLPYSRADLVSLGASDSNAVLLGAGAVVRVGDIELFGEVSADVLVERGLAASPVRVAIGVRAPLVPRVLALHVALEGGLAGRLPIDPAGTLTPVEPRIALVVGLVLSPRSQPAIEEAVVGPAPVVGRILDPSGAPIAGARVHVVGAPEPSASTDADGAFTLAGVPEDAALEVEADGYITSPYARASGELVLARALPEGTLRGLVRSLTGEAVVATIGVQPGGAQATTDADGVFEIALQPGHYELLITAPGHHRQHRAIDVELGGVTVINVDLERRR